MMIVFVCVCVSACVCVCVWGGGGYLCVRSHKCQCHGHRICEKHIIVDNSGMTHRRNIKVPKYSQNKGKQEPYLTFQI